MKKILKIFVLLTVLFYPQSSKGQGLNKERVEKLKRCVVRITMDNTNSMGTGFFISGIGEVMTCWHVIQDALKCDSLGTVLNIERIYVTLSDGKQKEYLISPDFFQTKLNTHAVGYDYCVLTPVQKFKTDFYELEKFETVFEGDEIYTAGYPLGITNQFISKGILSTKYIDSSLSVNNKIIRRSVALLDLTLNKGNSGGPIIRINNASKVDKVVGIADFLLNPFAGQSQEITSALNKFDPLKFAGSKNLTIDLTKILQTFSQALMYSSNGISGCISTDHFLQGLK